MLVYGLSNSSNCDDLECRWKLFLISYIASLFKCHTSYLWHVARSLCICRAYCVSLLLLEGDTCMPRGLHSRLCQAFLVLSVNTARRGRGTLSSCVCLYVCVCLSHAGILSNGSTEAIFDGRLRYRCSTNDEYLICIWLNKMWLESKQWFCLSCYPLIVVSH